MPAKLDYVSTLKPEILEKAKEEFGEDEFVRFESVLALREWLKKQPHLQNAPTGDDSYDLTVYFFHLSHLFFEDAMTLLKFLRGCKFSLEKAKAKLDCTLTLRNALPEFFSEWDPMRPEIQAALSVG